MDRLPVAHRLERRAAAMVAALAPFLVATAAFAAETAEHGEAHQVGMPQLDSSTFASQIFWLIVAFATLYYLLKTKALPRVGEILETRQDRIAADLDRAARLRADAEEALRRHESVVAEAQSNAQARIREAQERMSADVASQQAAHDADLARKLQDAERRIGTAKREALGEVAGVAAEVVQAAVARLGGIEVSPSDARAAVDRLLAEGAR